ncbi:unnamed protein product [Cyclocybe aegerita]|uniref:Protein kinase domain-containing protein n=1 Tax=Cyclocybe aegerita TaxID=1973307 RepID=A0A8S0WUA6_CYCAE|nr:unnamed protein product [Cyclocybe aegerita]
MAHARRSPQYRAPSSSISSPSTTRRNLRKRAPPRSPTRIPDEFISSPLPLRHRPVLVPLHPNLRRLPSRIYVAEKDQDSDQLMRESSHVITGSKRKRVVSTNENAHTHGRPTRGSGRLKRIKTSVTTNARYHAVTSEESQSEASEMEVDLVSNLSPGSDDSDVEVEGEEGGEDRDFNEDSSDEYYINTASPKNLNRLLKARLVELYELAGLTEDPGNLKKSEIIDAIVNARDDVASVPPSSPPRGDGASSDYSSDDGHFAGDEGTDIGGPRHPSNGSALRRRVTLHDISKTPSRPLKSRSLSMGNLLGNGEPPRSLLKRKAAETNGQSEGAPSKRKVSTRSSSANSATGSLVHHSPPATRLRTRNASGSLPGTSTPTSTSSRSKGKGKAKQVEFSNDVEVHVQTPSKRNSKGKQADRPVDSESDLTELESEKEMAIGEPSPRRLRSKDRECAAVAKGKGKQDPEATPVASSKRRKTPKKVEVTEDEEDAHVYLTEHPTRKTPMRKAKKKIGNLKESDLEEGQEEEDEDEGLGDECEEVADDGEGEDDAEEEEVDELVSSASITPPPESRGRRTTTRRRLRPRRTRTKTLPTGDDANEGDDEEEVEGDEEQEDEDGTEQEDDDEATIAVEPRRLRNGKIVGEEEVADEEEDEEEQDAEMEVDEESIGEEDEEDEAEDEAEEGEGVEEETESADGSEIDVDAEGETDEDEAMEEEVDLTIATAKTLVRLRRDDLVRLCETRDLDPSGTKPQLAEALLQWRDRHANDFSSPSSAGTVRPSSNRRRRRGKNSNATSATNTTVPVLLRSEHTHTDEPRTPVPGKEKENEELELDLESLGLEDREIPVDKLTKLEKIGSGGFKDVFIGKFKNRKIAIAEFRGQLSAMDIKELKLLGAFNHPNIVRFLGVSIPENTKETPVMIVSELCSNGDLFDYIRNVNAPSLHKVLTMMLNIAHGLEYLHTRKPSIIHRDCKSSNILITAKGAAKIADFGLAKVKQSTRSMVRSLVGTVNWQAPELWHAHPKYNHKVDVFSCAMVFWEMLQWHLPTKKFPWEGMNEHAIYEIVGTKRQRPSIAGLRKQWCPEIIDLVERMWAQEHQDRPTMTEVVEALEELVKKY